MIRWTETARQAPGLGLSDAPPHERSSLARRCSEVCGQPKKLVSDFGAGTGWDTQRPAGGDLRRKTIAFPLAQSCSPSLGSDACGLPRTSLPELGPGASQVRVPCSPQLSCRSPRPSCSPRLSCRSVRPCSPLPLTSLPGLGAGTQPVKPCVYRDAHCVAAGNFSRKTITLPHVMTHPFFDRSDSGVSSTCAGSEQTGDIDSDTDSKHDSSPIAICTVPYSSKQANELEHLCTKMACVRAALRDLNVSSEKVLSPQSLEQRVQIWKTLPGLMRQLEGLTSELRVEGVEL
mmetsp:Transcript_16161/g.41086  ORF Transcript_16161/g.41086 Transcript_16161/m.41086 type:complete len:289 (-) Transcript_16161:120-986(-)